MWYCSCRERIYGSDPHCLFFRPKGKRVDQKHDQKRRFAWKMKFSGIHE